MNENNIENFQQKNIENIQENLISIKCIHNANSPLFIGVDIFKKSEGVGCFPWIKYAYCSNNSLHSVSLSFATFVFLLTWDSYYFKSNLGLLMYIKVLLT